MGACCAVSKTEAVFMEKKEVTEEVEIRRIKSTYQFSKKVNYPEATVKEEEKEESSSNQKSTPPKNKDPSNQDYFSNLKPSPISNPLSPSEEELKRVSDKNEKLNKERAANRQQQIKNLKEFKKSLESGKVIHDNERLIKIAVNMLQDIQVDPEEGDLDSKTEKSLASQSINQTSNYNQSSSPRRKLMQIKNYARRMKRSITQAKQEELNGNPNGNEPEPKELKLEPLKPLDPLVNIRIPASPTKGLLKRSRTSTFYQESRRRERLAKKVKFQDLEYIKDRKRKR